MIKKLLLTVIAAQQSCPPGMDFDWAFDTCVCPEPLTEVENGICGCEVTDAVMADGQCKCSGGRFIARDACVCPRIMAWNEEVQQCLCPDEMEPNEARDECKCTNTDMEFHNGQRKCLCKGGKQLNKETGSCACPFEQVWNGKRCLPEQEQRLFLFDTDMSADAATAFIALLKQEAKVVAVTTVGKNQNTAVRNAGVLMRQMKEFAPIYQGCKRGFIEPFSRQKLRLGKSTDLVPKAEPDNAVKKIIELVKSKPGQIEIIILGPLTNLAMAIRLEPNLPKLIKKVIMVGGAVQWTGKVDNKAELNFYKDPEAAFIVFKEFEGLKKLLLLPKELCFTRRLDKTLFRYSDVLRRLHKRGKIMACATDAVNMLFDESMVESSRPGHVKIEFQSTLTRGRSIINWYTDGDRNADVVMALKLDNRMD